MWSALARIGEDPVKVTKNLVACTRAGAAESESNRDWQTALAYWEHCLAIAPDSADARDGFGRALARLGRAAEYDGDVASARAHWERLQRLFPADMRASLGLLRTGARGATESTVDTTYLMWRDKNRAAAEFFFDVSDLADYFRRSRAPTGIQRIAMAVVAAAFGGEPDERLGLCMFDPRDGLWRAVDPALILIVLDMARGGADTSDQEWSSAVEELRHADEFAPSFRFPRDAVIVSLGSPWGIPNYFLALREAKRASNVFYCGYVHDTVPLLHPEFVYAKTADAYRSWVATIGEHADMMLANSENTRRDFLTALERAGTPPLHTEVIHPNGDFSTGLESSREVSADVAPLLDTSYVLFVGTIEPRKDHLFVLNAWRQLADELGAARTPTLVIAGRLGWQKDAVLKFLHDTHNAGDKVVMLNNASDVDLEALYRHARFTVYNSHYEGWGLPVSESFSYGKVPVVARNSSLIESGGKHAVFYETNSARNFITVVRRLIEDPEHLKEREHYIAYDPPLRSWHAIFEDTYRKVGAAVAQGLRNPHGRRPPVRLGQPVPLWLTPRHGTTGDVALGESARAGEGWFGLEDWGAWTGANLVQMEFDLTGIDPAAPPRALWFFMGVRGHREGIAHVVVSVNGAEIGAVDIGRYDHIVRFDLPPHLVAGGHVDVTIEQDKLFSMNAKSVGADPRTVGIGLRQFLICTPTDLQAQVSLLEGESNYIEAKA